MKLQILALHNMVKFVFLVLHNMMSAHNIWVNSPTAHEACAHGNGGGGGVEEAEERGLLFCWF